MIDLSNFNNFTMLKMFNLNEKNIHDFKVYDVPIYNDENKVIRNVLNIDVKLVDLKPEDIDVSFVIKLFMNTTLFL